MLSKLGKATSAAILVATAAWTGSATAQTFPNRAITFIYPYAAGSAPDAAWRALALEAGKVLGQTVIYENRVGAGGRIGFDGIMRAAKDGYTIGVVNNGLTVTQPLADPTLKVEPGKDYAPIIRTIDIYQVLVAHPSMPFRDLRGMIAYAKANPGKLNYSSGGAGNQSHVGTERLKAQAGIEMMHIPYKGEGPAVTDLIAGQVQVSMPSGSAKPFVDSGKLVALATTGPTRWHLFPNLPTLSEAGLPGLTSVTWMGVVAPAGTPPDVVAKLNAAFNTALKSPEIRSKLQGYGFEVVGSSAAEFDTLIRNDLQVWAPIIKNAGIKLN